MSEDLYEDKMLKAFAEILGVNFELVEAIAPYYDEDTGSSDDQWHYGWCFDIPKYSELEIEVRRLIDEEFPEDKVKIPFGETLYFSDGELGNTKVDPFGWKLDYELEQYFERPLESKRVINEINRIKRIIEFQTDELIVKSLIFSCFSLVESFLRGEITKLIPNYKSVGLHPVTEDLLDTYFKDRLQSTRGRKYLYEKYSQKKFIRIPNWNIRNVLAHDIGSLKVKNDFMCGDGESIKQDIRVLSVIESLAKFVENFSSTNQR